MNKNIIKQILREGLNIPKRKKRLLWVGIDGDLMTSLDSYGFICRQDERYSYEDWMILGKKGEDDYFLSWYSEETLNDIIKGVEFADNDDIRGLIDYAGLDDRNELLNLPFIHKFHTVISYFGLNNLISDPGIVFDLDSAIVYINKYSGEDPISIEDYL